MLDKFYGVIKNGNKALCVFCGDRIIFRTYNIKRHCETNHKWLFTKTTQERGEIIIKKLKNTEEQTQMLTKYLNLDLNLICASFAASYTLIKHGKPFSDGEVFKNIFVNCASFLFDKFDIKEQIINLMNKMAFSRNTIKNRMILIEENITKK